MCHKSVRQGCVIFFGFLFSNKTSEKTTATTTTIKEKNRKKGSNKKKNQKEKKQNKRVEKSLEQSINILPHRETLITQQNPTRHRRETVVTTTYLEKSEICQK